MKKVNETLYKIIKIYKEQSFYFIHNCIYIWIFQSLISQLQDFAINATISKLLYYTTLKISFKREISVHRERDIERLEYRCSGRSHKGWETKGRKRIKELPRLWHVRRLRAAKEAAYIIITVGRWARHSIGSANEGSVIITHDLTPSCSCKDLYCNRSPFVLFFFRDESSLWESYNMTAATELIRITIVPSRVSCIFIISLQKF